MRRNFELNPRLARHIQVVETYIAHESVASPRSDTLDDLIATGEIVTPHFVKVDVEGAEATVLAGAQRMLHEARPHLLIETHSRSVESECLALLRSAGYIPTIIERRRWLPEDRGNDHNRWLAARGVPDGRL
jgi:hypothetical protein